MIFLVMGAALTVLLLWSIVSTPRVARRFPSPRVWIWWATWICAAAMFSVAALAQGIESMGWMK